MKQVTTNQICSLIMLVIISNKLLILPALIYERVGLDAILIVLGKLILAFFVFWLFAYLVKKYPNKTLEDYVVPYIGKIGYTLLLIAFGALYLLKSLITLMEGDAFLTETIYEDFDSVLYVIPTLIVSGYFIYKGLNVMGRTCELIFKFILWGMIITILLTIPNLRIDTIIPLFTVDADELMKTFSDVSVWFGNYFLIFLFLGKVKGSEHFVWKVLKSCIVASVLVMLFFIVYYSVFGPSSVLHNYAINDIVVLTPQLSSIIKIDWFTVIFYNMALIGQTVLQLYLVYFVVDYIFKLNNTKLSIMVYIAILAVLYIIMPFNSNQIMTVSTETLGIYCFILNLIFPLYMFVIAVVNAVKEKRRVKNGCTLEKE